MQVEAGNYRDKAGKKTWVPVIGITRHKTSFEPPPAGQPFGIMVGGSLRFGRNPVVHEHRDGCCILRDELPQTEEVRDAVLAAYRADPRWERLPGTALKASMAQSPGALQLE